MKDENPFKQKLYHHTLPVSDDLWNRIELQLPVVKKRFPFFWFTLASVVMIAAAVMIWPGHKEPAPGNNLNPEKNSVPVSPNPEETVKEVSFNTESEPQTTIIAENNSPKNSIQTIQNNSTHKSGKANNTSSSSIKNGIYENDLTAGYNSNISTTINSTLNPISDPTFNPTLSAEISSPRSTGYFNAASSLPIDGISYTITDELSSGILSIRPDPSCYKFTGQEVKSNLSVDFFAGPGFSPRSFENTSTGDVLYSEARNATEKSRYAWSGGARMNLKLNQELAVRIGITYEHIGDVFDYTDTMATQQQTIIDTFWSANGTFLYTETRTILILGTLIKKIHNRYHRLDIPLLASYELSMGRAKLMINAGPVINIAASSRGQILDPNLVPRNITIGESNYLKAYKNTLGLSVYLGAGALIPFNKNFSGLIEPRFMYRIKPVTIDSYPIKEHRHFAGINLGIRYHFD